MQKIDCILKAIRNQPVEEIEASIISYISKKTGIEYVYSGEFLKYKGKEKAYILRCFELDNFPVDIEFIVQFFENLLSEENVTVNGIVFTPLYIADFINRQAAEEGYIKANSKIIDPGCGCGIFLIASALYLHNKLGKSFLEIYRQNLYGIDILAENVLRSKIVLSILPMLYGEPNYTGPFNIEVKDSLKENWSSLFRVESFDFIEGNPPYVNTHDMREETIKFLKETFQTTSSGVFNIFYAFIEHGMKFLNDEGMLSYIIPNNFLTIKSALDLRKLIAKNQWLKSIIDFANNMVFKPVRTYNSIIQLTKGNNSFFKYCVLPPCDDIKSSIYGLEMSSMDTERLDANGWKLVDKKTLNNIRIIENQLCSIKDFIRTGIATLKDEVYFVDFDGITYYKIVEGVRYPIDASLVKSIYKIPELKNNRNLSSVRRFIIFPYEKSPKGYVPISEEQMLLHYPDTYRYFCKQRKVLDSRDKGKEKTAPWFAYGRSQGLNKYGRKLVFPTFANTPRFILVDDPDALFCNGYAVFEDSSIELELLQRVLNSAVMHYYISNTSYAIEGGYYCYQKKYIERFSIPFFSLEERERMRTMNDAQLDSFLRRIYQIEF